MEINSLHYILLGKPKNLTDLLNEADKDWEKGRTKRKIHLIADYSYMRETSRSDKQWVDGYIKARYWAGKKKIEVYLWRFDSRKPDYSKTELMMERIGKRIGTEGFEVGTIRIREMKNRRVSHCRSVETFPKS